MMGGGLPPGPIAMALAGLDRVLQIGPAPTGTRARERTPQNENAAAMATAFKFQRPGAKAGLRDMG